MTRHWTSIGRLVTIIALAASTLAVPAAFEQTPRQLEAALQAAIRAETIDGDLRAAIAQYEEIAKGPDRALAAAALLRMAGAYEKLGEAKARRIYTRIVDEFADQRAQVLEAQSRLFALTPTVEPTSRRRVLAAGNSGLGPAADPLFSVSADGQRFVFTNWVTGDLARSDLRTGRSGAFYGTDYATGFYQGAALSPDGRRVAFVYYPNVGGPRVEVDDFEGGAHRVVYDEEGLGNVIICDWSPDGKRVLMSYTEDQASVLGTLDVESGTLDPLLTLNWQLPRRAEYSPDGRFIAYDSSKGGDRAIYLIDVANETETVLVDSQGDDDSPVWTADGRFLVFRTNRRGDWDLFGLAMEDGRPAGSARLLESSLGEFSTLRGISNDGRLFVHERLDSGRSIGIATSVDDHVRSLEITGVPKVQTIDQRFPVFDADGQRVIFRADNRLQAADLEGHTHQITKLESSVETFYPAAVSPDGSELALIAYVGGAPSQVMLRSAESGEPLREIRAPEGHRYGLPVRWSADQRTLYAVLVTTIGDGREGGRDVAAIDSQTGQILETISVPAVGAGAFSFSPNRELFTFWNGTRLVVRSLVDGSEKAYATKISVRSRPLWTADSRTLLFMKAGDVALYALSLDTGKERVLVTDMEGWRLRDVSPDGTHWVAGRETDAEGRARVWVLEHFLPEPGGQTGRR